MIAVKEKNKPIPVKAFKKYFLSLDPDNQYVTISDDMTFDDIFSNRILIIMAIRAGIPYSLFTAIMDMSPFSQNDWSEFLDLSVKSLQRYKQVKGHVFKPIHSEKILELAEVNNLGRQVFDSADQFHHWLYTPSYALGNMTPAELLKDSYGKEMVIDQLHRIDNGIFV